MCVLYIDKLAVSIKRSDYFPYNSWNALHNPWTCATHTPYSKRKYTLCFLASTQTVSWVEPATSLRDSQSEFCNNQAWVCEKIPSGSKVPRTSLLGSCVGKFTKICFCHWLLCYWLTEHMPPIFASELWNQFEFFHKLGFVWCGTPASCVPYHVMGLTWPRFWVLTYRNSKCILSFGVECMTYISLIQLVFVSNTVN